MDTENRLELMRNSKIARKIGQINEQRDVINKLISVELQALEEKKSFHYSEEGEELDSKMMVCVRTRPVLEHERGQLVTVHSCNPDLLVTEPGAKSVRTEQYKVNTSKFQVDMAFGPEDDNDTVYTNSSLPLLHRAATGGVGTLFTYGQTGSGKTFTVMGIIRRLAADIFSTGYDNLRVNVSYIQLLGNKATDLLADNKEVDIMEDKFGKVNIIGAVEKDVDDEAAFLSLVEESQKWRSTSATLKNDTSSRSHMICRIRFENTAIKAAEDGFLFLIDLAGSENAADTEFHDKDRIKETKEINKSLMCLKECIRNRARATADQDTFVHIPYRQSKLTLLLKEAFEVETYRLSRTVVIANVAPTILDVSVTLNTLRYAAPIKQGIRNRTQRDPDMRNPANWSNVELAEWWTQRTKGKVRPETLCPWETGRQFLSLPETEVITRICDNSKIGEKMAKDYYVSLWKLMVDARSRERRARMKPLNSVMPRRERQRPEPGTTFCV